MKGNNAASRQPGLRNTLIAVLVIVVVGVSTFYGVSYLSSMQPPVNSSSSATTSGFSTATGSSADSSQSGSISTGSIVSSQSTAAGYQFNLAGSPSVAVHGNTANLSVSYSNTGATAVSVNLYLSLFYPNGTLLSDGNVFYPAGPTVDQEGNFTASYGTPQLAPPGTYSVAFYVINAVSQNQVSSETTESFTIVA